MKNTFLLRGRKAPRSPSWTRLFLPLRTVPFHRFLPSCTSSSFTTTSTSRVMNDHEATAAEYTSDAGVGVGGSFGGHDEPLQCCGAFHRGYDRFSLLAQSCSCTSLRAGACVAVIAEDWGGGSSVSQRRFFYSPTNSQRKEVGSLPSASNPSSTNESNMSTSANTTGNVAEEEGKNAMEMIISSGCLEMTVEKPKGFFEVGGTGDEASSSSSEHKMCEKERVHVRSKEDAPPPQQEQRQERQDHQRERRSTPFFFFSPSFVTRGGKHPVLPRLFLVWQQGVVLSIGAIMGIALVAYFFSTPMKEDTVHHTAVMASEALQNTNLQKRAIELSKLVVQDVLNDPNSLNLTVKLVTELLAREEIKIAISSLLLTLFEDRYTQEVTKKFILQILRDRWVSDQLDDITKKQIYRLLDNQEIKNALSVYLTEAASSALQKPELHDLSASAIRSTFFQLINPFKFFSRDFDNPVMSYVGGV